MSQRVSLILYTIHLAILADSTQLNMMSDVSTLQGDHDLNSDSLNSSLVLH